jgi:acyl-CoA synthetase (AMP-forming)/AMP-acid ligase II
LTRLQSLLSDSQAALVLTTARDKDFLKSRGAPLSGFEKVRWLSTDDIEESQAEEWSEPELTPSTLAILQYTSGSTSSPKGVMLTHGNILHNNLMIKNAFEHNDASVVVGWLPLYHDMGLIGNLLQPLFVGCRCVLLSPMDFLLQPIRWLRAVTRYQATTSGGPTFAYELCLREIKPEQREELNLRHWNLAFIGAEPVRFETIDRFSKVFGLYGFKQEAFYPCYGLAEASLIVTGGKKKEPPVVQWADPEALKDNRVGGGQNGEAGAYPFVGCGKVLPTQRVMIVDPVTSFPVSDDQVGEIWVSGENVGLGYWNRPDETQAVFAASLGKTGEGPFLRTGDIGFLRDGELFIVGRVKDLIIIRGKNHAPHDIEWTVAQSYPGLRPEGCVAFSVEKEGGEQLVILVEVAERQVSDFSKLKDLIRQWVLEHHELRIYSLKLLKKFSLPKTSSGKVKRQACKLAFLSDSLEEIA